MTFDTAAVGPLTPGTSITEGDFTYSVLSGELYVAPNGLPGNDVEGVAPSTAGLTTDILKIVAAVPGGTFTVSNLSLAFVGVDGSAFFANATLDGNNVFGEGGGGGPIYLGYNYFNQGFDTTGFPSDELDITLYGYTDANGSHSYTALDSVTLTPLFSVPEPASIAVLGANLVGLACVRRKNA